MTGGINLYTENGAFLLNSLRNGKIDKILVEYIKNAIISINCQNIRPLKYILNLSNVFIGWPPPPFFLLIASLEWDKNLKLTATYSVAASPL